MSWAVNAGKKGVPLSLNHGANSSNVTRSEAVLAAAETLEPAGVGTLDAIHLATALRLAEADLISALITYDVRLAQGAREHGLVVISPA